MKPKLYQILAAIIVIAILTMIILWEEPKEEPKYTPMPVTEEVQVFSNEGKG